MLQNPYFCGQNEIDKIKIKKINLMNEKLKKSVKDWLGEQPWYEEFEKNLKDNLGRTVDEHIDICMKGNIHNLLNSAFNWVQSPEGPSRWADRNNSFLLWLEEERH